MGTRVYVGNLNDKIKKEDLEEQFTKYGKLNSVWVAFNPPGFAFVEFENRDEAEKACDILNGTEILGSQLRVEISKGRPRQGRRGGPGGGGRFRDGGDFRRGRPGGGGGGGFRSGGSGFGGQRNGGGGGGFRSRGPTGGGGGRSYQDGGYGGGNRSGGYSGGRDSGYSAGSRDGASRSFGAGSGSYGGNRSGGGPGSGAGRFRSRSPAAGRRF